MMIPIAKPLLGPEEKKALLAVIDSGMLASGPLVKQFEAAFAAYCNVKYGIAVSSGTTALQALLHSLELAEGDKILTTPFTFIATANSILSAGARPVFADIDPAGLNLAPAAAEAALQRDEKIKAILLVHIFGLPCDIDAFRTLAEKYDVLLLEDAAQAHGAQYKGQKAGSFGKGSTFSFYPTKNMTTGEGGIVLTDDEALEEKVRLYINHGSRQRYHHETIGFNYRMTDLAAALGLEQIKKLPLFNEKRQANAAFLSRHLQGLPGLSLPSVPTGSEHVFHQYTIRLKKRDALAAYLREKGIGTAIHYPIPLHKQACYKGTDFAAVNLREAEKAAEEVLSLPVHPALKKADLTAIISAVKEFWEF